MTNDLHRSVFAGKDSLQSSQEITEADVLIAAALASRPARSPDFAAENQALRTLAQHLTDDPQSILKTLVGLVLDLCRADTVGVSLLETAPNGESVFRWVAIAGALLQWEQTTTPGNFSPCGTTVSCNQPQLYTHPERYFTYLADPQFPIVEELLIPLCVNARPLGTLWIVSHSEARQFDAEDQRLMMSFRGFAASALHSMPKLQQAATTALPQSEKFNQQILNSSDDCIKVLDLEGRILFMSEGGQALLGIQDITPFLNTSWPQFWEGAAQQAAIEGIARARAGEVCSFQGYRPTLLGEPKWWDCKISPIRGVDGQVERLLCISRDITERRQSEDKRKQAEDRLRHSEERLSAIFSQAAVGLCEISLDGHFQRVNDELCRILGRSREEILAAGVPDVTHPEDVLKSLEAFEQLLATGQPVSLDKRYLRPDGTIVWANSSLRSLEDEQGRPRTVLAVTVDLSDRKRAEAAIAADLRDTKLLHDLSVQLTTETDIQVLYDEIMATAIVLTEADAGTVQILDTATQDLVLLATQGFERNLTEHFHRVNASSKTSCGIALKNGNRTFIDFDVPESEDLDGSLRMHVEAGYLFAQSTPLITRSGKPIGMVSTHWRERHQPSDSEALLRSADRELRFLDLLARQAADLIEQKRIEVEREQLLAREQAARAEADRANRIKDEFLAVLSHELRSPLNPILGWSKLLQSGKLDATKTQQALKTIERNAHLQSELIEDLLDVSRILQGKLNLNVSSINLVSIIQAAMETVRLAAEAKSIKVEASLAPDVGLVWGDSTRLQQVIWNLLSNAVKFTDVGGQVNIRLEYQEAHAYITVSDTGQGIAPEFLPYLFDYFRQADAATTRKFGGLGLGLAIVRHLVELHGGAVGVESLGIDMGATFTVRLPLMPIQATVNQNDQSSDSSSDLNGIQVLVVDDEPDSREFVAFVLEQAGANVMTATTADEALTTLIHSKPDVLLSDIGMPKVDGYMLMQQVRALPPEQGGQIPAIALTAYAGDFNQQQALRAGFQQHVSKPVEPEVLVRAITSLLNHKGR